MDCGSRKKNERDKELLYNKMFGGELLDSETGRNQDSTGPQVTKNNIPGHPG